MTLTSSARSSSHSAIQQAAAEVNAILNDKLGAVSPEKPNGGEEEEEEEEEGGELVVSHEQQERPASQFDRGEDGEKRDEEDMYAVLGVGVNASTHEVSKAYRRLVLEYHPDRNRDPIEQHKFHLITTAGSVLRDQYRRMLYDMQHHLRHVPEEEVRDVLVRLRRRALRLVENMAETVHNSRQVESAQGGLVVLKALYGDLRHRNSLELPPASVIDVTTALQCMVEASELVNESSTKMFLDGFCDPCPYQNKTLFIRYLFQGALHQVCYEDRDAIRVPMREHAIDRDEILEEFLYQTWATFPLRRRAELRRRQEERRRSQLLVKGVRLTTGALAAAALFIWWRDLLQNGAKGELARAWQRSLRRR